MRQVLKVSDLIQKEEKKESKGIEFTHVLHETTGWSICVGFVGKGFTEDDIVYLGQSETHGDMFALYRKKYNDILIYKGHLNDGTY